jgi:hypothetical protein
MDITSSFWEPTQADPRCTAKLAAYTMVRIIDARFDGQLERNQSWCALVSSVLGRRSLHPTDEDLSVWTPSPDGRVNLRVAVSAYSHSGFAIAFTL